jgi:hypothetical protein
MEHWQLDMLDSIQWKELEAPMGFVAAIKRQSQLLLEEEEQVRDEEETETSSNNTTKRSSDLNRLYPSMLTSSSRISERDITPRKTSERAPPDAALPDMEEGEGKVVVETVQKEGELDNKDDFGKCRPPQSVREIMGTYNQWGMSQSFMFSPNFQRAVMHSKSGGDLKAYTLFVLELNVVVSALLCGAAVEMWGVFPQDTEDVPREMTLSFHLLSFVTVLMQLLSTFSWVGCLFVAGAVSPDKFATYCHQVEYALSHFLVLSELATVTFVLNIGLLFSSFVWCNTSGIAVRALVGIVLPTMIVLPLIYCVRNISEYIARTAFHGLLLMDGTTTTIPGRSCLAMDVDGTLLSPSTTTMEAGVLAQQAEDSLCRSFHDHSVPNVAFVLDAYAAASTKSTSQQQQQQQQQQQTPSHHGNTTTAPDCMMAPAFRANLRQTAMQPT